MPTAADHADPVSDEPPGDPPRCWFITFPQRLSTRNHYRVVIADTCDDARQLAFAHHGQNWAFVYPIDELADQVARFHLQEITPPLCDDWGRP